jgi:[ribosomal protein S5]-alanine N-acetyltransferase
MSAILPDALPLTEIIETDRLLLRVIKPETMKQLYTVTSSGEEHRNFLGITSEKEYALFRERYSPDMTTYFFSYRHFIIHDKRTGAFMGRCDYHTWQIRHFRAEIGYALNQEYRGKGYMREALKAVLLHGFEEMELHRVEAFVGPANLPSINLVKNFGFKEEGLLREHYYRDGRWEDSACFSLLRGEYEELRDSW